jgi:hypothetical protein
MTVSEFMAEAEYHRPKEKGDYAGSLTRGDVEELAAWMETWDK